MTKHDWVRKQRALDADWNSLEEITDAVAGLQSTDDPSLVYLYERYYKRYEELKAMKDEIPGLTQLGSKSTNYQHEGVNSSLLEVFQNKYRDNDYVVRHCTDEVTSLCPVTGQPDFGEITIEFCPGEYLVESKSLKLYLGSYRNAGTFMEAMVNRIKDDLSFVCQPKYMKVTGIFAPRGGIQTTVVAEYGANPGE